MRSLRKRAVRSGLAALIITALLGSGSLLTTAPALAAETGPPVTFALAATDRISGAPISEVVAGGEFHYSASSGCPDPAGCGPATLTVQFPEHVEYMAGEFTPPNGVTVTVAPEGGPATGKTVTLTWANLEDVSVARLPARVPANVSAALDGAEETATAVMVGGTGENTTTIETEATIALRVFDTPGLVAVSQRWNPSSVPEGTGAEARATLTGTAAANTLSTLIFQAPSGAQLPSGALPVSEVFDLLSLTLDANPTGARVIFGIAGGQAATVDLAAGELVATAPAGATGYRVEVSGLPALLTSSAAERTVTVHADYSLRATQRTNGERIVDPAKNTRQVRASALVTNEVLDPAPGVSPSTDAQTSGDISVEALLPVIENSLTWVTATGDNTSVYGSKEPSVATLRAANVGQAQLRELRVEMTRSGDGFFEYQTLEATPDITFPRGAATATLQYLYPGGTPVGLEQPFAPGTAVPGPDVDSKELSEVAGIIVTFFAADGSSIDGECALDDDDCAARVVLSGSLRDARLSNGNPIVAPPQNPGTTTVRHTVNLTAVATTGATVNLTTNESMLLVVKPQLIPKLSKRYGDGTTNVVYPLTGVAQAGDLYDPDQGAAGFRDHAFRLVASTETTENATETQGVRQLTIVDPQTTPTLANLKSGPFNTVRFTALPTGDAVCTTGGDEEAGEAPTTLRSTTDTMVWVVDRVANPQSVTKVPLDDTIDLELVVGVEYTIMPLDRSVSFPVDLKCSTPAGATVKFREHRLSDGELVSPDTIGSSDSPGLFAAGNTAELRTGQNTATATGSDQLFLIDLERAAVYKSVAPGSRAYGIQDQNSPTAFLLSGVPAGENSVESRIIDGDRIGSSLDIFALTGFREARVGPDQEMTLRFRDRSGAPIGPVGTVSSSTELNGEAMTPEDIENSQSAAYLAFQKKERDIDWSGDWAEGDLEQVFTIEVSAVRSDPDVALQRYGAFSVIADMTLRSARLSDPSTPVEGSLDGKNVKNYADLDSRKAGGSWTADTYTSSADFRVFAASELYGGSELRWNTSADNDNFLVGLHQTGSKVTLDAWNKTALGVKDVAPENQWAAPNSFAVGVQRLSASIGDAPTPETNPFLITDFHGIDSMRWPMRDGAGKDESNADKRVAGTLTYHLVGGGTVPVPAPVDTLPADLNPHPSVWKDVIGITVSWEEDGKYVGTKRPTDDVHGRLVFLTSLRDTVRSGMSSYTFQEGTPGTLAPGAPILGPLPDTPAQVAKQVAVTKLTLDDLGYTPDDTPGQIAVVRPKTEVGLTLAPSGSDLYRDPVNRNQQLWTAAVQNRSNISVASLHISTDKELLEDGWPDADPEGFAIAPGSVFDAFDVTRVRVTYPTGATQATVWARGEDGSWSAAIAAANNTALALPSGGAGPHTWSEVTGLRVRFDGDEANERRIAKGATGSLRIDTQLRDTLRSNPSELAPATELPAGADSWESSLSAAGSLHLTTDAETPKPISLTRTVKIHAGTPSPMVRKFAGKHTNNLTSAVGNPGAWINFDLVVENRSSGTSDLYDLVVLDQFPEGLRYNAVNENTTWSVAEAPDGVSTTPSFALEPGTSSTMRWTWPTDQTLKPGEKIVLTVPLQVSDGSEAGTTATNTARIVGAGIPGALMPSVCADDESVNAACTANAYVTSQRNDSVRGESYIDARHGSATAAGEVCDPSTAADWADGSWVRNPCVAETTTGDTLRYRIKLINSGNGDLERLRFVDELPELGDRGTVLSAPRGSEFTSHLVPGSVRLLGDDQATGLGARGDGQLLGSGVRYSATENACTLNPDAFAGQQTLRCDQGTWSATPTTQSKSFGADIGFPDGKKLRGGEYVIIEFLMTVPSVGDIGKTNWNTAAVTGQLTTVADWLPATETPVSGARTQDASMTVSLSLEDTPAAQWHLLAEGYTVDYSCLPPGTTTPVTGSQQLAGISDVSKPSEFTIEWLPRGAACQVTNLSYTPTDDSSAPGQYGSVADGVTGFSYRTEHEEPIVLGSDPAENILRASITFVEATVEVGVTVDGNAAQYLPADAAFVVEMRCEFGGVRGELLTLTLVRDEKHPQGGLPVGANCVVTETDHRGAGQVSATLDGTDVELSAERSLTAAALDPGEHAVSFRNTFDAGGALTVLKQLELPQAGLSSGDVAFAVSCAMGDPAVQLDLGEHSEVGLSFAAGQTAGHVSIPGLPIGAECTLSETLSGGAHESAPDRTVTILPDEDVVVEMVNRFDAAALELSKTVTGAGAGESRVPDSFSFLASCTRELTVSGEAVTVTDYSGTTRVRPGTPVTIGDLVAGASCAVSEIDPGGAERVEASVLNRGVENLSEDSERATVELVGPTSGGGTQATGVQIENRFAKTAGPGEDLGDTGAAGDPRLISGLAILLTLAGMAVAMRARRKTALRP